MLNLHIGDLGATNKYLREIPNQLKISERWLDLWHITLLFITCIGVLVVGLAGGDAAAAATLACSPCTRP